MTIRGHIEGGGTFELRDDIVAALRSMCAGNGGTSWDRALAAALPPEPYVPQVGDKVQFQWSDGGWSTVVEYRGEFEGCPVLFHPCDGTPVLRPAGTKLRKAGGA